MGANVSTQVATVSTTLQNVQQTNCKNDSEIDQSIGNIEVNLVGSKCGDISFTNTATVSQMCDLSGTASALAQAAQGLSAQQKASLSLSANISTGVQDNTTKIQQILDANCGSASKINQTIKGAKITIQPYVSADGRTVIPASCDILKFANSAGAQQQCILKTVTDTVSKLDQSQAAVQTQESIGSLISGLLTGPMLLIFGPIILIILVVVVIVIVRMLKKKPDDASALAGLGDDTTTGGTVKCSQNASGKNIADANGLYDCSPGDLQKGGGSRRKRKSGIRYENLPIVVIGIFMLVWYAKITDPANKE